MSATLIIIAINLISDALIGASYALGAILVLTPFVMLIVKYNARCSFKADLHVLREMERE